MLKKDFKKETINAKKIKKIKSQNLKSKSSGSLIL